MKEGKLYIKIRSKQYAIPFDEIIYMAKELRKILLVTTRGNMEFYGSFCNIREFLDDRFLSCHKSFIINMDKIVIIENGSLVMSDGSTLTFGSKCFSKAKKAFEKYYGV